jgi:hypothetical protein
MVSPLLESFFAIHACGEAGIVGLMLSGQPFDPLSMPFDRGRPVTDQKR